MKVVIFAGGIGTRMWPVSRVKTPKQFNPVLNNKSTLELMYDHVAAEIKPEDIYISTNQDYKGVVSKKLPNLPQENILGEPAMRDLGPAVGYAMGILNKLDPDEPVAILWADDLIKKRPVFQKLLHLASDHLEQNPNQIVYIGQKPLFADQNKGWIHYGEIITHYNGTSMHAFKDWHYRPPLQLAQEYFRSGEHAVNTGYFITKPRFIMSLYQKFAPEMNGQLTKIIDSYGQDNHQEILQSIYPQLEKISFDDLIIEKTSAADAVVLVSDLGWFGFGDWQSIKEALQETPKDTITEGHVINRGSQNSIVYNYTNQLVTAIGVNDLVIVATPDAIMVCPQDQIPEVKKMLKDFEGTEFEKYT